MINKILFFYIVCIGLVNIHSVYSMGEIIMEKKTVNLVERFDLYMIDRIEIKGDDFDKEVKGKSFVIMEKPAIEEIINNLKELKKGFLCDCKPRYRILFYKQKQLMVDLGFQDDDSHYYLRYDNQEQFILSKDLFDFLKSRSSEF